MSKVVSTGEAQWPALPLAEWQDTYDTLHMWTQIVGKVRLALTPKMNHWWDVALYVNPRGLTTSAIPYDSGIFEIRFDFLEHQLVIETSKDQTALLPLTAMPVAEFYREFRARMASLGIQFKILARPAEVPDPIPFEEDYKHASYDAEYAGRFWRVLMTVDTVFKEFRSRFIGKSSPVHFFWGSFDMAATRFSGRRAPERPGADSITREAYSHEVISAGFWPGGGEISAPAFYAYAAPEPSGYPDASIRPGQAFYHKGMSEYLLMYDDVRNSVSPKDTLLEFLQSTYEAGAELAHWDRSALERDAR